MRGFFLHIVFRHSNIPKNIKTGSLLPVDNGKTICLETIKYFNEEKSEFEWGEFSDGVKHNCIYLEHFKFGDEFHDWFDKTPKWTPETKWPNSDEEALVINLYENKIKVSENK